MLYNIVVVLAIHRHESAMDLHVFPIPIPPPTSLSIWFFSISFWWKIQEHIFCFSNHLKDISSFCLCSCSVAQSCITLCNPIDCSSAGSSVQGISQARILEWVAISFSRVSSQPSDQTWISCLAGRFLPLSHNFLHLQGQIHCELSELYERQDT